MRIIACLGCILAVFFALTGPASAMIQVDQGIAGARIGASRSGVQAALGKPARTKSGTNDFGPYVQYAYAGGLTILFQGKASVTTVRLTGKGDRTTTGVGIGSSEAQVEAGVKDILCETISGARSCHTGSFKAGQRVTDFSLKNGKVTSVTVGLVVD